MPDWVQVLAVPLTRCVSLGKLLLCASVSLFLGMIIIVAISKGCCEV